MKIIFLCPMDKAPKSASISISKKCRYFTMSSLSLIHIFRNEEAEKRQIIEALRQTGNNKSRAAQLLGIDRKTCLLYTSRCV